MEIEHINDDTIRVKIDNSDLVERGITFLDLLGSQSQIESFFYSILEEIDIDDEFRDSEAVTFQVMPKNNGLELFISKGTNYKEDFLENMDEETFKSLESLNNNTNTNNENNKDNNKDNNSEENSSTEQSNYEKPSIKGTTVSFSDIEQVILMAQEYEIEGSTTLYSYKGQYYLSIRFFLNENSEYDEKSREVAHAKEFGEVSQVSKDVLDEYAKVIIKDNALDTLRHYFK